MASIAIHPHSVAEITATSTSSFADAASTWPVPASWPPTSLSTCLFPRTMHAVQISLFEVVNALANKRIDHKAAGLMLYAMQQASINLNDKHASQGMCHALKPDEPLLALEFRDFEEQYHLPKGIDLEANPEVALQESGTLPETTAVETTLGIPRSDQKNDQKSDRKKRRKHHRRGERVPLPVPKELWQHVDPDAPFRAYTSDGRELTRKDAERWQKRKLEELVAFVKYGDTTVPVNLDEPLIDIDQRKQDEDREVA
jgi:hypothetical protein